MLFLALSCGPSQRTIDVHSMIAWDVSACLYDVSFTLYIVCIFSRIIALSREVIIRSGSSS